MGGGGLTAPCLALVVTFWKIQPDMYGCCRRTWKSFVSWLLFISETTPLVLYTYKFVFNPFYVLLYFFLAGKGSC